MTGNLLEWCEDSWHENYDGAPTDGSPWISTGEANRVIRGGCWNYGDVLCRSAFRSSFNNAQSMSYLGFRIVRVER